MEPNKIPTYHSHKKVQAFKIGKMQRDHRSLSTLIGSEDGKYIASVSDLIVEKHKPQVGWYYVLYQDGYVSFSPAKAFEEGYTLIEN